MIGTDENIPTMDILELYEKETGEKSTWEWQRATEYYLEYLGTLLKKHSQGWWD